MGADGHIVICKRADWDGAGLCDPRWLGLRSGQFLGQECCWGYFGDNLSEPNYTTPYAVSREPQLVCDADGKDWRKANKDELGLIQSAATWFEEHSETHEVWT